MVWICCDLWNELRSFYVRMIFDVVCYDKSDEYCGGGMKCFYGGIHYFYDVTWNGLCGSHDNYDSYIYVVGIVTFICCACTCPGDGIEKLIWCNAWCWDFVYDDVQVCLMVVSIWTVCYYMTIFITFKAMYIKAMTCDVTELLTYEALVLLVGHYINCRWRYKVAVSCCTAWIFSTLLIPSARIWGPFS